MQHNNNSATVNKVNNANNSTTVSNAIASTNNASAVATANVLTALQQQRAAALAAKQANKAQRTQQAKALLQVRALNNALTTQRKAKLAKQQAANSTINVVKVARYNSIYANVTNMHTLAAMLIFNNATQQQIATAFIAAYALKNVTNVAFILQRVNIYMQHAKTMQQLAILKAKAAN